MTLGPDLVDPLPRTGDVCLATAVTDSFVLGAVVILEQVGRDHALQISGGAVDSRARERPEAGAVKTFANGLSTDRDPRNRRNR